MNWSEFDQYDYCIEYETSDVFSAVFVIEFIKNYNKLPIRFNKWDAGSSTGWAAAHEAASAGILPKNFKNWELIALHGRTVAHIAALYGNLPEELNDPNILNVRDNLGRSVLDYKKAYSHIHDKYLIFEEYRPVPESPC